MSQIDLGYTYPKLGQVGFVRSVVQSFCLACMGGFLDLLTVRALDPKGELYPYGPATRQSAPEGIKSAAYYEPHLTTLVAVSQAK